MAQKDQAPELTVEWLRDQLVVLLGKASGGESPDHAACAKYGELLYKMLPKKVSGEAALAGLMDEARELARAARKASASDSQE